jgi:hypothetical protein
MRTASGKPVVQIPTLPGVLVSGEGRSVFGSFFGGEDVF